MSLNADGVSEILDDAEAGLNGVSRSMLAADPLLLQESQRVLERLVERLNQVKAAQSWPPGIHVRLRAFGGTLRRLQMLSDSALAAISMRTRHSSGGYSANGIESAGHAVSTVAFDC